MSFEKVLNAEKNQTAMKSIESEADIHDLELENQPSL